MGERRENYPAKIEEKRRRRRYFVWLFWLVVAVGSLGAFVDSVGWERKSVLFLILGLGAALGVFVYWLTETIDKAIIQKTEGAITRGTVNIVYPRVWDFECSVSRQYIEGLLAARGLILKSDPSKESNDESADKRQDRLETDKIKIEEYANRLRVHWWRSAPQPWRFTPVGRGSLYEWEDLDRDIYTSFDIYDSTEFPLWQAGFLLSSEKPELCGLNLTLSGESARRKERSEKSIGSEERRRHLQLTLWIKRPSREHRIGPPMNDTKYLLENPDDIVFRVPLEPDLLGHHEANEFDEPGWKRRSQSGQFSSERGWPAPASEWSGASWRQTRTVTLAERSARRTVEGPSRSKAGRRRGVAVESPIRCVPSRWTPVAHR